VCGWGVQNAHERRVYEVIKKAEDGNACRVSVLAGCEGLVGMAWYFTSHVPPQRYPTRISKRQSRTESSRPCFERARNAVNGASADHQE
jgi:hypothetical protein